MRSQAAGTLVSPCQTMRTGRPATASRATFTSRSQLDPGKTTTQASIDFVALGKDAETREERVDGLLALLEILLRGTRHEPIALARRDEDLHRGAALAQTQELDLRARNVGRIHDS